MFNVLDIFKIFEGEKAQRIPEPEWQWLICKSNMLWTDRKYIEYFLNGKSGNLRMIHRFERWPVLRRLASWHIFDRSSIWWIVSSRALYESCNIRRCCQNKSINFHRRWFSRSTYRFSWNVKVISRYWNMKHLEHCYRYTKTQNKQRTKAIQLIVFLLDTIENCPILSDFSTSWPCDNFFELYSIHSIWFQWE